MTTRDKGTGLGLPIVKKIIEEHGGTLGLEPAEPFDDTNRRGAVAVIRLPVMFAANRQQRQNQDEADTVTAETAFET